MNRTIKDATVKRYFYETHDQLRTHLRDFVDAYNFARRLKTLKGSAPHMSSSAKAWTSQPLQEVHNQPAPANAGTKHLGHPTDRLTATLASAVLREDAGFHAYQMLEAGVRQFAVWGDTDEGRHILIAVARYLAAHSPTERATFQTADIAADDLMRGRRSYHLEAEKS